MLLLPLLPCCCRRCLAAAAAVLLLLVCLDNASGQAHNAGALGIALDVVEAAGQHQQ